MGWLGRSGACCGSAWGIWKGPGGISRDLLEARRRRRELEGEGREALLARVEEALQRLGAWG